MKNKHNKLSSLEDFFDDDPTDELPTLTERALAEYAEDSAEDTGQLPVLGADYEPDTGFEPPELAGHPSIDRLEDEIEALQSKWLDIEHELRDRDGRIEQLEAELEASAATLQQLEFEHGNTLSERESATKEIARLQAELAETADFTETLQSDLRQKEEALCRLERAAQAHEKQLREHEQAATDLRDRVAEHERAESELEEVSKTLGMENQQLRLSLQDLRSYIDGRRPEWNRLKLELGRQSQTLKGLEAALAAKEKLLERHGTERATLRDRINELETRCETLAAERDAAVGETLELRARAEENALKLADAQQAEQNLRGEIETFSTRAARAEEKSAALEDAEKRFVNLEAQLSERVKAMQSLEEDLACRHGEIESLHGELMSAQQRLDEAMLELATRDKRIDELEEAGTRDSRALESTRAELAATIEQRDVLGDELARRETQIGDLQAQAEQLESERERLSEDLGKQAQIIKDLEQELREKLHSINMLSRNVDRLALIEANVRKLDERMSSQTDSRQAELPAEVTRLMVTRSGPGTVKYPISKDTVTIGRAADSDIQIKRQYISRHHARILSDPDGTVIEDLNSKNGILVNAQRVQRQRLRNGDTVDIGKVQFTFIDLLEEHAGERNA